MIVSDEDRMLAGVIAEVEAEGLALSGRGVPYFNLWLPRVSPEMEWGWPHLSVIRKALRRITSGERRRLILEVPPQHGKSEQVTIRYPVWRLLKDPGLRVAVGSYSQTLANRFSRRARKLAIAAGVHVSSDRSAAEEWETEEGGSFRAVGRQAGITGHPADLLIVDDPVKNRKEAESKVFRDAIWDWWTNDLYTRLGQDAAAIVIMTRWHTDDLVGRILASDDAHNWEVVRLPALAEDDDPLGRKPGEALCPQRYNEAALAQRRIVLGRDFDALYQQRPVPREGGMFKYADLMHEDRLVYAVPRRARRVRYWDTAASVNGDYTVGLLMAYADDLWWVEDIVRGRWESAERRKVQRATAVKDHSHYGLGVTQWQQREPGSGGKDQEADFMLMMAGFPCATEPARVNKVLHADPFAAQVQAGNVRIMRAPWTMPYIDELTAFDSGEFDDQVDTSAGAFNKLALVPESGEGFNPLDGYRG
ncbi:MAG TPA: phage terminase large subunit [Anaerolineales bacterium]|nr:phage terminase large subunit [Anaerolineales bacterium]